MGIAELLAIVVAMIKGANAAYTFVKEIAGDVPIPSWEDLIAGNTEFQKKIDKEAK